MEETKDRELAGEEAGARGRGGTQWPRENLGRDFHPLRWQSCR
jgi:hypothetical protein